MRFLSVLLISMMMISGFAVFAESAPAKVDIHELQRELKKIQETGSGLRMVLFFEQQKDFADAGSVFADMYQDSLADLEVESKNTVEKFFGGKDTAQALDEAIRYIGSLKKEDQGSFNLFTSYLLEKMGKTAPAELKQLESRIAEYEIESASVDLKDRGLLDKFKEWYLKRYENLLREQTDGKDGKTFVKKRNQIFTCIKIWDKARKIFSKDDDEDFGNAWNKASEAAGNYQYASAIKYYNEAWKINPAKATDYGVRHYIGHCHEGLKEYFKARDSYQDSVYHEVKFWRESFLHIDSLYSSYFGIEKTEANLRDGIALFMKMLKNPPEHPEDPETTFGYTRAYFRDMCYTSLHAYGPGSWSGLFNTLTGIGTTDAQKEKYRFEQIENCIVLREEFAGNIPKIDTIQRNIYMIFYSMQGYYSYFDKKEEYYLEAGKAIQYLIDNNIFPESYSRRDDFSLIAGTYADIVRYCKVSKEKQIQYCSNSAYMYEIAADLSESIYPGVIRENTISAAVQYISLFSSADSKELKEQYAEKWIRLYIKNDARIPLSERKDKQSLLIQLITTANSSFLRPLAYFNYEKAVEIGKTVAEKTGFYLSHFTAADHSQYDYYKYSDIIKEDAWIYHNMSVDYVGGKINEEYAQQALERENKIIADSNIPASSKDTFIERLLQRNYYNKKYDLVIQQCNNLANSNPYGVSAESIAYFKANCLREQGKYQEALTYYAQGYEHVDKAIGLARAGQIKEGFNLYAKVLSKMVPANPPVGGLGSFKSSAEMYYYKKSVSEFVKVSFSPSSLSIEPGHTGTFTGRVSYADGSDDAVFNNAGTNWQWKAEGSGAIQNYTGNTATYLAGNGANDSIEARCTIDLKTVLGLRGDFDGIVEVSGKVSKGGGDDDFIVTARPVPFKVPVGDYAYLLIEANDTEGNPVNINASFVSSDETAAVIVDQHSAENKSGVCIYGMSNTPASIHITVTAGNRTKELSVATEPFVMCGGNRNLVDLYTGNMNLPRIDYAVNKTGIPLMFSRTYNSLVDGSTTEISMGNKWTFNYNFRLELHDLATMYTVCLVDDAGARYYYMRYPKDASLYISRHPEFPFIQYKDSCYIMRSLSGVEFKFKENGKLAEISTPDKDILKLSYTSATIGNETVDMLTRVEDRFGRSVAITYNSSKRIDTVAFSTGRTVRYVYDERGNLVQVVHPLAVTESYEYNEKNQLVKMTDPMGNVTSFVYDTAGKLAGIADPLEGVTGYEYTQRMTRITDKNGSASNAELGTDGILKSLTLEDTSKFSYKMNLNKDLVSVTDPLGQTRTFDYDKNHNVTAAKDPLSNTVNMKYDARFNYLTELSDPLQRKKSFTYDENGRLTESLSPLKDKVSLKYDDPNLFGQPTAINESDAVTTVMKYDQFGYPAEVSRQKGNTIITLKYVHSSNGLLQTVTDMAGAVTKYEYDELERVTKVINPDNSQKTFEYDKNGNVLAVTDELENRTEYSYDKAGRLVTVTLPDKAKTAYSYDKAGNLVKVNKADGSTVSYLYDKRNRVTKITDEAGKITLFTYDKNSNLIKKQNPKGNYIVYEYDALNRITKKIYYKWQDSPEYTIDYTYDAAGNLVGVKSENTDITYAYNELNQIIKENSKNILETDFAYNSKGMMVSESSAYLNKSFTYDDINRLLEMKANGLSYKYIFDKTGRLSEFNQNNVISKFTYDISSRVTSKATEMNRAIIEKFDYKYDAAGKRIYEKEESDKNPNTYAFDAVGRLAKATYEDGNFEEFGYNLLGERISRKSLTDTDEIYVYENDGKLKQVKNKTFTYDENGNIAKKTISKFIENRMVVETTTYEFNARDLLSKIILPDSKTIEYDYDALGRRISIKYDGKTRKIVYSGSNKVAEFNEDRKTQYVYDSGVDEILSISKDGNDYHCLKGTAGSVGTIVNKKGEKVKEYKYRAFGNIYGEIGEFDNDVTYTSRELDKIAGIYYYRARYYDAEIGRFLSKDSYPENMTNPYSYNKYMYCNNDPVNFNDPMGLWFETAWDIANVLMGLADIKEDWKSGNYTNLAADIGCTGYDSMAAMVPFLPAGTGTLKNAARTGKWLEKAKNAIAAGEPLSARMKQALRQQARRMMGKIKDITGLEAHHIDPLEWAHLMGEKFNPNNIKNLAAVPKEIHKKISNYWTQFRNNNVSPTAKQVEDYAEYVKEQFSQWF